jgi:hypothetical protein
MARAPPRGQSGPTQHNGSVSIIGVVHVVLRRQARGDVPNVASLVRRKAAQAATRIRSALLAVAREADLGPADVSMEIPLQLERHLLVHSGEPHPPGDLPRCGVVQFTFQ